MELKTYEELRGLIKDEDVVAFTPFTTAGLPMEFMANLIEEHQETGQPNNLTIMSSNNLSDYAGRVGIDQMVAEGMVKTFLTNILTTSKQTQKAIENNEIEAYTIPQGVMATHYRLASDKTPGVLTKIGLHTHLDPRLGGGKANEVTTKNLVHLVEVNGEEYLHYDLPKPDVLVLRATYADEYGNIYMTQENYLGEGFSAAVAVKNNGGKTVVQVKDIIENHSKNPKEVFIPAELVDYVVLNEDESLHKQLPQTNYDPKLSGEIHVLEPQFIDLPFGVKKVILRRASQFLRKDNVVSIGFGISNGTSKLLYEENVEDLVQLNMDLGMMGGFQGSRETMGMNYNSSAVIRHDMSWDFIYNKGIDIALLSFAEVDENGNVNVSLLGNKVNGIGGFIDISQSVKRLVFSGKMMINDKTSIKDGQLEIEEESNQSKFVKKVKHIDFNGKYAKELGQEAYFVTDRAVFKLIEDGIMLIEVARGVDLQKDVLDHMAFEPLIADEIGIMDEAIYQETWGGLKDSLTKE